MSAPVFVKLLMPRDSVNPLESLSSFPTTLVPFTGSNSRAQLFNAAAIVSIKPTENGAELKIENSPGHVTAKQVGEPAHEILRQIDNKVRELGPDFKHSALFIELNEEEKIAGPGTPVYFNAGKIAMVEEHGKHSSLHIGGTLRRIQENADSVSRSTDDAIQKRSHAGVRRFGM